jgi:hypothetical protein
VVQPTWGGSLQSVNTSVLGKPALRACPNGHFVTDPRCWGCHGALNLFAPRRVLTKITAATLATTSSETLNLMFAPAIQPGIVSLLSSTGSNPLQLFHCQTDSSLPSESVIHLVHDTTSQPPPPAPATLIDPDPMSCDEASPRSGILCSLDQTVLHIQSPHLTKTYIRSPAAFNRCGPRNRSTRERDLGLKHTWLHMQVRNLGRPWSFEFGLVDHAGRLGVVRCSTFQVHVYDPFAPESVTAFTLYRNEFLAICVSAGNPIDVVCLSSRF